MSEICEDFECVYEQTNLSTDRHTLVFFLTLHFHNFSELDHGESKKNSWDVQQTWDASANGFESADNWCVPRSSSNSWLHWEKLPQLLLYLIGKRTIIQNLL